MTPFVPRRPPLWTISSMADSQQAHAVVTRASRRSIKGIARASQTHDAHQERLADCTWKAAGTAQKGAARRTSGVFCWSTKTYRSARRSRAERTVFWERD